MEVDQGKEVDFKNCYNKIVKAIVVDFIEIVILSITYFVTDHEKAAVNKIFLKDDIHLVKVKVQVLI